MDHFDNGISYVFQYILLTTSQDREFKNDMVLRNFDFNVFSKVDYSIIYLVKNYTNCV